MSQRGQERSVKDSDLVEAIKEHSDPCVKSKELAEQLPIGRTRINQLLLELEEKEIVESKGFGSGKGWWLREEWQRA